MKDSTDIPIAIALGFWIKLNCRIKEQEQPRQLTLNTSLKAALLAEYKYLAQQ